MPMIIVFKIYFGFIQKKSNIAKKKNRIDLSKNISEVTATTDTFPLNDSYSVAIQEWMLYSLWGGDDEQSPNYTKGLKRYESFLICLVSKASR